MSKLDAWVMDPSGQRSAYEPEQISRFVTEGLAWPDEQQGCYRTDLSAVDLADKLDELGIGVCDFCSRIPVTWSFPTRTHVSRPAEGGVPGSISIQDWAACEPCGQMIRLKARDQLLDRAVVAHRRRSTVERLAVSPTVLRRAIRDVQAGFWAHRRGHGQRIERS